MKTIQFISGKIILNVIDNDDFINEFDKELQNHNETKTFIVDDWGEGWVSTVDVEDKTNKWIWQPINN
jgi:hypothetical protein